MKRIPTRQILLLVVVVALAVFNVVRYERVKKNRQQAASTATTETTGVWPFFDKTAALRDEPDAQFQPSLAELRGQMAAFPDPNLKVNADMLRDVRACIIWLQFYRQSAGTIHPDAAWHARSTKHVDACVREHRDASE